jgi:hypothetical protein
MYVNYAKLAQSRRIAHCGGLFVYSTGTAVSYPVDDPQSMCPVSRFLENQWLTRHSI